MTEPLTVPRTHRIVAAGPDDAAIAAAIIADAFQHLDVAN